jgi:hypothetical protein
LENHNIWWSAPFQIVNPKVNNPHIIGEFQNIRKRSGLHLAALINVVRTEIALFLIPPLPAKVTHVGRHGRGSGWYFLFRTSRLPPFKDTNVNKKELVNPLEAFPFTTATAYPYSLRIKDATSG